MSFINTLIHGDCFNILPYVKTECDWDRQFNIPLMWREFNRIIKPNGCICVFALDQFSAHILIENECNYRYKWIWDKVFAANFANFKTMPLRNYEEILVFYQNHPIFNPQMKKRDSSRVKEHQKTHYKYLDRNNQRYSALSTQKSKVPFLIDFQKYNADTKNPELIIEGIPQLRPNDHEKLDHATQKPSGLYEYLIKTYTNPNMVVLDAFAGSMTVIEACLNFKRKYIAIELEKKHIQMGLTRLKTYFHNGISIQQRTESFGIIYSFLKPIEAIIQKEQLKKVK
jgi:site-specific DNA-methyltransferase (adenine-specific)